MRTFMKLTPASQARRLRGVTLVELLVAMVISLIAITAIFQVFSVFEGQKRTTMGGGEAQTNGALALFTLERELRQAGYGVNSIDYLGCSMAAYDETTGAEIFLPPPFPANTRPTLAPVQITQGAGEAPDTLTVLYGNGNLLPQSVNLIQTMATATVPYRVTNRFGFQAGDVVVLAETGKGCAVGQANILPGIAGQLDMILHDSGNYTDPNTGLVMPTRYNKPGGLGPAYAYTFNAKVFNLGQRPSYNVYSVQNLPNGQLAVQQMLSGPSPPAPTVIYDGIVQLQAQYGQDTNGDGIIDVFHECVPPTNPGCAPTTAAEWATILAVRIGVVARSGLREKTEVTDAVTVPFIRLWPDSAVAPTTVGPIWTPTSEERHYRYKVFHTVVPVRNMIWRP